MKPFLVEVFYIDNHTFELLIHSKESLGKYTVFAKDDVNSLERVQVAYESELKIQFDYERNQGKNPVFEVEFETGLHVLAQCRILPIAGMFNFRDLGGYPTEDGRIVKWGKLFRGDHLFNLKDEGQNYIDSLGLKVIVDLRTSEEQTKFPNRSIPSVKQTLFLNPDGHIAVFAGALQNNEMHQINDMFKLLKSKDDLNPETAVNAMINQQKSFVTNPKSINAYSQMLKAIANPEHVPNFHHCKGGKDRTGYATMLILGLLNVSKEFIIYDYMLTKRAREKKNQAYYQMFLESSKSEKVADYLYSLFDTKEEFILAAYDTINHQYGSITSYCREILGISDIEINYLQQIYTESFVI